MPDTTVKYFDSTMSGAPAISGTAGTLIAVLDACLVNGFGAVTLDSLTVAGNVATATVSAGHGFAMLGTYTGPVVEISGATPAGLNGQWRVASVPSSTQFTFATSGMSDQTATGTITAKRAPAGWAKAYSGTNKAAYRIDAVEGSGMYLRVDDSPAQYPTLRMYESMSDIDTGTGASTLGYTAKSNASGATARPWAVAADHRFAMAFIDSSSNAYYTSGFAFGDIDRYSATDAYACGLWAHGAASVNYMPLYSSEQQLRKLARGYAGTGGEVTAFYYSFGPNSLALGSAGLTGMNPATSGLHLWPLEIWEGTSSAPIAARGILPGLWNATTKASGLTQGAVHTDFAGLPGRDFIVQNVATTGYRGLIDMTGPWRGA